MTQHIIITGNPMDGLMFHGPFDNSDDAIRYAEQQRWDEWWLANLQSPFENVDTAREEGCRYERAFGDYIG